MLSERFLDVNSYVRVKVLQVLGRIWEYVFFTCSGAWSDLFDCTVCHKSSPNSDSS
jgi:hypothetical protein